VLEVEVLILEGLTVDGNATGAITIGEVASLAHEAWNDTMEDRLVVGHAFTLLAGAQRTEVLGTLGCLVLEELKDDSTKVVSLIPFALSAKLKENIRVAICLAPLLLRNLRLDLLLLLLLIAASTAAATIVLLWLLLSELELATISNDNLLTSGTFLCADTLHLLYDVVAIDDTSKDGMLAIKPWGRLCGDEELGTVGVGTRVGHGEEERFCRGKQGLLKSVVDPKGHRYERFIHDTFHVEGREIVFT